MNLPEARLGLAERYPLEVVGPVQATDHFYFARERIPAISIGYLPYPEYHLPEERLELVESQLARPVPRS